MITVSCCSLLPVMLWLCFDIVKWSKIKQQCRHSYNVVLCSRSQLTVLPVPFYLYHIIQLYCNWIFSSSGLACFWQQWSEYCKVWEWPPLCSVLRPWKTWHVMGDFVQLPDEVIAVKSDAWGLNTTFLHVQTSSRFLPTETFNSKIYLKIQIQWINVKKNILNQL